MFTFRILTIIFLLLWTTSSFAQRAHNKRPKKEEAGKVYDDLDEASKGMLLKFSADYDSVVFLMRTGGYGFYPVMDGFGFIKENVFQLQARGQFAKSKISFNMHLDTILRNGITSRAKISSAQKINFAQLSSLNSDSLLVSDMAGSDISYYAIRLIQNNRYVLKGWLSTNPITRDERVFDEAVEQLDALLEADKP